MPSDRVTRALLSRGVPLEEIQTLTEGEAWSVLNETPSPRRAAAQRLSVCFTGFGPDGRQAMHSIALAAGHHVASGVNKSLAILVCGDNPGPSKLQKARAQGAKILSEAEYRAYVDGSVTV